jgi:hypothetical protein
MRFSPATAASFACVYLAELRGHRARNGLRRLVDCRALYGRRRPQLLRRRNCAPLALPVTLKAPLSLTLRRYFSAEWSPMNRFSFSALGLNNFLHPYSSFLYMVLLVSTGIACTHELAHAQKGSPNKEVVISRQDGAIAQLNSSIAAMGGEAVISSIHDSLVSGTATDVAGESTFSWCDSGWEFRYEYQSITDSGWKSALLSGHGHARIEAGQKTQYLPPYARADHIPFPILGARLLPLVHERTASVTVSPVSAVLGKAATAIDVHFGTRPDVVAATKQTWYFDPATAMPVAVDYFAPDLAHPGGGLTLRAVFTDYEVVGRLTIPRSIRIATLDNQLPSSYRIETVLFNQSPSATSFDQK